MFKNRNRIALSFSLILCLAFLGAALLLPVSAGQPQPVQAYTVPHSENGDTAIIQVAYEPPPALLQAADEPTLEGLEPTPEPTAESTVEPNPNGGDVVIINNPPPEKTDNTPLNLTNLLYAAFIAVLGGGSLALILSRLQKSKQALDAGEAIYESKVGAELREHIRTAFEGLREVNLRLLDIVDKITDGLPNTVEGETEISESAPTQPSAPTVPGSNPYAGQKYPPNKTD